MFGSCFYIERRGYDFQILKVSETIFTDNLGVYGGVFGSSENLGDLTILTDNYADSKFSEKIEVFMNFTRWWSDFSQN